MGQVDCWPMQCPPILPTGSGGCVDSAFADYNKPVADCCAPRCNTKAAPAASLAAVPTVTAVTTATDPCSQLLLNEHHDDGTDADNHNSNNDNDNNNHNSYNNTIQPAAAATTAAAVASAAAGKPCFYDGRYYQSGARWDDPVDMCTSCDCKVT